MTGLRHLWNRFQCVSRFTFSSKSPDWDRKGHGFVKVKGGYNSLYFEERGEWTDSHQSIEFTNNLRWGLEEKFLTLEHMRLNEPVFLLDFVYQKGKIVSHNDHLCGDDLYKAEIKIKRDRICFSWDVKGPKKSERIEVVYL